MNINKILLTLIVLSVSIISFGQPLVIEVTGDPVFLSSQFNVTEAGSNFNNRVTNTSGSLIAVNSENFWDRNANRIKWEIY
ncbi:MAG: hypothetical protein HQ541_05990, partial [Mariniphaga sp.]|nr:hypothetical protein [Mariniphaga sp.]